uniref:Uncharacterized protein n=1 Tax=Kalanchoe fedtschenkoi TaxID=63787 RepID=A0A7N0TAF7_KALFE
MAGGGGFLGRVVHYVLNQLIVDTLANSPSFQRFAVRTSRRMEELKKLAEEKSQHMARQMKEASRNLDDKLKN